MGQKISDLKGVFGIMEEDKDVEEVKISVEGLVCVNENTGEDDNGNAVTPIYVTSETGRREVEENGNFPQPSSSEASGSENKKRTKSKKETIKKKKPHWVLRFNCARLKSGSNSSGGSSDPDIADANGLQSCVCTGHRRTEDHHLSAGVVFEAKQENSSDSEEEPDDTLRMRQDSYSLDDCDTRARLERAREIEEGVDPPPGFRPHAIQLVCMQDMNIDTLTSLLHSAALSALSQLDSQRLIHTQVDYIHCLVPDLLQITTSSFYWGKMDRYEAERLLDGKQEGTFLLRDSAQEEYLFSVSFRKYNRSLHARIEQWKHLFSFDSHDPGVFSSPTVCGLIEHYKDPTCCMFFEPMLTIPLHRNFAFPLQHIARAVISSKVSYDGISQLKLPKPLKAYLKEYHYKQRVKVRRFDNE